MSLWGSKDQANNSPKNAIASGLGVAANGSTLFGNTQSSAFVTNMSVGDFGVDAVEAGITTGEGKKVAHAGWNMRKSGTGPVVSISANNGYSSNGYITFTGGGLANTPANATVTVDANSKVVSVVLNSGGRYESTPTATRTGNAVYTLVMGGRANRVHYETLVAMGSMSTNPDAENTIFPNS